MHKFWITHEAMAVVLDALVPYVMKMIADMVDKELSMLLGIEAEIQKLNNNVVHLQDYLTDADRRRITDKNVKTWVGKLKDVMYEATDVLELCQLEAMERPEKSYQVDGASSCPSTSSGGHLKKKLQGRFQPLLFCLRNPVFAHETGSRIKKLKEDLDNIRKDATNLNFINLGSYEELRKLINPAHIKSKKMTSGFNVLEVVGENIQKDAEQLVQNLIAQDGRDLKLKVVAIVGQGGMGKSLLAKKVFASEAIQEEFKTKIWLSVTQHFDKAELLRSAITHGGGRHNGEKDESILERTLTEALSTNKFLLVLDDVWSDGPWKDMLQVPAANASCTQPGSRVLVTSRMEDVVRRMGATSRDLLRVRKLDDEDAWSLLKQQLPEPELRHLRYLRLKGTDISRLPEDIHKMKFLEHIALFNCKRLNRLPDSITKLERLRFLALDGSNIYSIPMGFGAFKRLTAVYCFPAKMYGDWCSLQELGPLCDLRNLSIQYLENVPGSSTAARAMLSNKKSLIYLDLNCYRDELGDMGEKEQRVEAVFNGLCPPPSLEDFFLSKYFGHRPPIWMQAPAAAAMRSLKFIRIWCLSNCNQLPNGLCGMLNLEEIRISHAPSIEVVGPDFQSLPNGDGGAVVTRPFPKLKKLMLCDLPRWKEWDWEEEHGEGMAMPALEYLKIVNCKLSRLPQGLASHNRYNLRTLYLHGLSILASVENFPSVVEFNVLYCPKLKKIRGFSKLRKISINGCPKLKLLEGFPGLCSMVLDIEPWEITGTPAVCTPKVYQVGLQQPQLPDNFTVTR